MKKQLNVKEIEAKMEARLVEEFQMHFYKKIGYFPFVITKSRKSEFDEQLRYMSLEELEMKFTPFLPKTGTTVQRLKSRRRNQEIVELRHMFSFLAKKMGYSLASIANHLELRDHSTIIHGLKTFRDRYETDLDYRDRYDAINNYVKRHTKHIDESSIVDNADKAPSKSGSTLFS